MAPLLSQTNLPGTVYATGSADPMGSQTVDTSGKSTALFNLPDYKSSYTGGAGFTNLPDTISSSDMTPVLTNLKLPSFPQTDPNELKGVTSAIPDLASITAAFNAPSQAEQNQTDFRSEILNTLNKVSGKNAATLQAENAAGIPDQQKTLLELSNRLTGLKNESLAIPLAIQEQFAGTGATAGGAEPIQTAKLRQNAIQALSVSAQAQAVQGNIALAQQQVDRAIALEFEPEERKLAFLQQAYQFNREDLERVDKKRADLMGIQIEERKRVLDLQKNDKSAAMALATAAVQYFPNDPTAQNAAQKVAALDVNDPDYLQKVFQLVGPYQQDPLALAQSLADLNYKKALTTKAYKEMSGGGQAGEQLYSGLSSSTSTAVRSKVGKFSSEPIVQNFATIQEGYNFASALNDATQNPADDQALIYSLAKALDPGSVVREGEYATAQKYAQSWIDSYGKGVEQALLGTGFLSQSARKNIKQTIKQKYEASKTSYDNLYKNYSTGINNLTGREDGTAFLQDYYIEPSSIARNIDQYSQFRNELQAGELLILRNGQPFAIQANEFNPRTDTIPPDPSLMSRQ